MQQFIKHFRREGVGVWVCTSAATLDLPQGRVQVAAGSRFTLGTRFMNIELAALLKAEFLSRGVDTSTLLAPGSDHGDPREEKQSK